MLAPPKIIPGSKGQTAACGRCTFLNAADAKVCGMCEAELTPPTHEVQANGMWQCGSCANLNRKGLKECHQCHTPFYSRVTSSAPSQIFCSQCGFLNDGDNAQCVQCDNQLRSTLEKISSDLRDSTNFLARDMGVNINVKCPGCLIVCFVPPATAGLRCGTCHTYFASPTVGDVTNFHMSRLASSISSSFRGFFSRDRSSITEEQDQEAPVGRLLAIGDIAQQRNASSSDADAASHSVDSSSASFSLDKDDENEEKTDAATTTASTTTADTAAEHEPASTQPVETAPPRVAEVERRQRESTPPMGPPEKLHGTPVVVAVAATASATVSAVPMAFDANDPQDLIMVEGDIVEL